MGDLADAIRVTPRQLLLIRRHRLVSSLRAAAGQAAVPVEGVEDVSAAPERRAVPLVRRHHVDLCRTSTAICPS
jgi:hypothetical protein